MPTRLQKMQVDGLGSEACAIYASSQAQYPRILFRLFRCSPFVVSRNSTKRSFHLFRTACFLLCSFEDCRVLIQKGPRAWKPTSSHTPHLKSEARPNHGETLSPCDTRPRKYNRNALLFWTRARINSKSKVFALPGGRLAPTPCGDAGALLARSVEAFESYTIS